MSVGSFFVVLVDGWGRVVDRVTPGPIQVFFVFSPGVFHGVKSLLGFRLSVDFRGDRDFFFVAFRC